MFQQESSVSISKNRAWLTSVAALLLVFARIVAGQQSSDAVVVGSVFDASRGAIPGASVALTHLATNSTIELRTDERGQFRTPPIRIGEYGISIAADGFKRFNRSGVVLNIGDVRQVDAVLEVGQVSESVSVEAAAPLLQTADSTVGTVINNKQIENLPLNGRDYLQLAALSSGTIPSIALGGGVSIGGQVGTQAAFLLDGLDNNSQQISNSHSGQKEIIKPSVDAIQEFKVVTNSYAAEFGRSSSGVVSVAIKSGSNDLHGSAYEFLRNEALDAKNYFATAKSAYKRNQFGAAIGAPIVRNRTFFFGDFEIGRIRQTATTVSTLPNSAQRGGLFSKTIKDPSTGAAFPNNQIPVSRIDQAALKVLGYLPPIQSGAATNNYIYASPQNQDPYRWDFRVDQIVSDKQNLYFRYSTQKLDAGVLAPLPPDSQGNYYSGTGAQTTSSRSFVLVHNRVWSSSLVSSIHAGWNYLDWANGFPGQKLTGLGIPGVTEVYPGFSQMLITGYPNLGVTNIPNWDGSQTRQFSGDLTWNKGAHNLKVGAQSYWLQTNFLSSQRTSGIFSFNGQYTGTPWADFLLGTASSASLSNWSYLALRDPYKHFFVQDDWKLSRRVTLNIGLRYELSPPAVQKNDAMSNFDLDTTPGQPRLVAAGSEGGDTASRALQNVNHRQFAPRIGFAYSLPDNKTVIRGGYGVFYSNLITLGGQSSMEVNPPNNVRVSLSPDPVTPSIFLSQGFAANALSVANAKNVELISYDRRGVTPIAQQWNLDIQRELHGGILIEAGYYGNKLDHMWRKIDGNPAPPGAGTANLRRQFLSAAVPGTGSSITLADVIRIQKDGYTRYNGLQVKIEKRYSKGVTFLASYGWSKTLSLGDTDFVQNPWNWAADRSVAGQDVTHHLVGSAVYALPIGRGRTFGAHWSRTVDAFLGGWSLGPIVTVSSGLPLNLTVNGTPSNTGSVAVDRPNVVGDWQLADPAVQQWFNTAAFAANAKYTFGNAGRNVLRSPGLFNLDLAAHKTLRLAERVSAQLRLESFNFTNTPPLGIPNAQVGNQSFGQISSAGTPRDNQVALKIVF
jgi:hypothetical protein